jgi:phenylacetate-CoA ligase
VKPIALYHRLPVILQEAALSLYGAKLRWNRYGGDHHRVLRELVANAALDVASLTSLQEHLLQETLLHAVTHVPYYRSLGVPVPETPANATAILRQWPLLSKATVQQAGVALLDERRSPKALLQIHTGGTTGRALAIYTDAGALRRNYAFFERFKRTAGIGPSDRVATFAGRPIVPTEQAAPPFWRRNVVARQLLLSSYHISPRTLDGYIDALEAYSPRWIDSYPSSLEPIARRIVQRGGASVRPVAIVTSSETLTSSARASMEQAFQCRVFDQYGSAEMVAFIAQCREGRYHVHPDYGFLELLDERGEPVADGTPGEIVATGFINPVMPLVRYRMGDLAVKTSDPCPCGSAFPGVASLLGRMDDVIVTPSGRRVGRIDPIFKAVSTLHEARVVQTAIDAIRLEAVISDGFTAADRQTLLDELRLRVGGDMQLEFAAVPSIPRTRGGKLRMVESPFGRATAPTA